MDFSTLQYAAHGRIATITLDRPERLNAIDDRMPEEIAAAVCRAEEDDDVHVLVVTGAGRAFCAGYDLKEYAEDGSVPYSQEMPLGPDARLPPDGPQHRALHAPVPLSQAHHRQGAGIRRGGRLRHRSGL